MAENVPIVQTSFREIKPLNTKNGLTVADLRDRHLFGVDISHPITGQQPPDILLWDRLREAEDWVERICSIRWQPTVIRCEPLTTDDPTTYDEVEAGYDYQTDNFDSYRWGALKLRVSPVTDVIDLAFGFPNRAHGLFTVPRSWIRLDGPFGWLHLVPDHGGVMVNFSSYMLSLFSSGRGMPQAILPTYRVGASPEWWRTNHSDLLAAVGELAAAKLMIRMAGIAASREGSNMSQSADGLSQSISGRHEALMAHGEKRLDMATKAVESWRQQKMGPLLTII